MKHTPSTLALLVVLMASSSAIASSKLICLTSSGIASAFLSAMKGSFAWIVWTGGSIDARAPGFNGPTLANRARPKRKTRATPKDRTRFSS